MKPENRPYIKDVIVDLNDFICECGQEAIISHTSNWHNGSGTFYVQCDCGKEFNVHWYEKPKIVRDR